VGVPVLESKAAPPQAAPWHGTPCPARATTRSGGADTAAVTTTASALVVVKDWTFLLGPGVMPAINALCFASILHQTRLVPRWIPTVGLIGAPLLLASSTATLFGAFEQVSAMALVSALPIATWELAVGVYLTVKGFTAPTVTEDDAPTAPTAAVLSRV
jgi:hypothetical protein